MKSEKQLKKQLEKQLERKLNLGIFILGILTLGIVIILITNRAIWLDESYSLQLIKKSTINLLDITSHDVHPPLYYLILKLITSIASVFGVTTIYSAKLVSFIPFLLLLLVACTKIRKDFGVGCSTIFSICILFFPRMLQYGIEIRMYSWAMFWVTLAFLELYEITEFETNKHWVFFTIFSLCAAYTHDFACLAVGFLYLVLLIWIIRCKKIYLKKWFICVVVTAGVYLPWMLVVIRQIMKVKENYWIEPLTLKTIAKNIAFIVCQAKSIASVGVGVLITFLFLWILYRYIKKDKTAKDWIIITGIGNVIFVELVGIIVSLLLRPIFTDRYIFPTLGCLWLAFSYLLAKELRERKSFYICLVVFLIFGVINTSIMMKSEMTQKKEINQLLEFDSNNSSSDIYIFGNMHFELSMAYYDNKQNYIIQSQQNNSIVNDVFDNLNGAVSNEEIRKFVQEKKTVWLFYEGDIEAFKRDLQLTDLQFDLQGTYGLEKYSFQVYKIY